MRNIKPRVGRVAPLTPNWSREVEVDHAFLTEIRTSRSGREQREALRTTARVGFNFNVAVAEARAQRLLQDLLTDQTDPWVVPAPWRAAALQQRASGAEIELQDPPPFWAVQGATLVVHGATQEVVRVASVVGGTVALESPLAASHEPGTRVVFAYNARYPDSLRLRAETPGVFTAAVRMEADPGFDPQPAAGVPAALYEGAEVLLRRPNWADRMDVTISREREVADFTFGRISVASPVDFSAVDRRVAVYGFDAETAENVLGMFLRMKGRRGAFWMPSWAADARARTQVNPGGTFFDVGDSDFAAAYGGSRTHNRMIAFFPGGGYQINRVTGISVVGGKARVQFANPWTQAVPPDARVHWMFRSRFASDTLTMTWATATVARTQFSVVTLPTDEDMP